MSKALDTFKIIVESIWFAAAGLCVIIAAREIIRHNYLQALIFVGLGFAAAFFFIYRRYVRKNAQNR